MAKRIDEYLSSLKTAAYTFNPPSPITVAKAVTIHLWLDPTVSPEQLPDELKKLVPEDAARVEAGETLWAPLMEASLKGDNFNISPVTPERQPVSSKVRTIWSWSITPKQPGEKQPLYLTINVVLPEELGGPKTIKTFEREIDVVSHGGGSLTSISKNTGSGCLAASALCLPVPSVGGGRKCTVQRTANRRSLPDSTSSHLRCR